MEAAIPRQPRIVVPTIAPHGGADGVGPADASATHHRRFSGAYERRIRPGIGHNLPQEAPEAFARMVLELPAA